VMPPPVRNYAPSKTAVASEPGDLTAFFPRTRNSEKKKTSAMAEVSRKLFVVNCCRTSGRVMAHEPDPGCFAPRTPACQAWAGPSCRLASYQRASSTRFQSPSLS
jgi:hypothetical protein